MKIDVYVVVWNEEFMLPYFLRHYEKFAQNIYAFNDNSTDRSVEILRQHPKVTIFEMERHGLDEGYWTNEIWPKYEELSRGKADWVMCVDVDEVIYCPNLIETLGKLKDQGVKVVKCEGFTMFSESLPTTAGQIYEEIKNGVPDFWFCKKVVFDPDVHIRFRPGRHTIAVSLERQGDRMANKTGIKLLHYRYLGRDYFEARDIRNFSRYYMEAPVPDVRIWQNQSHQLPDRTRGNRYEWFEQHKLEAFNVVDG